MLEIMLNFMQAILINVLTIDISWPTWVDPIVRFLSNFNLCYLLIPDKNYAAVLQVSLSPIIVVSLSHCSLTLCSLPEPFFPL